jgi:hypothetical protein
MIDSDPYCNLVDTNTIFNNKHVYKCNYCGIALGLDDINTKMFCFKKIQDYSISIKKNTNPSSVVSPIDLSENQSMQDVILDKLVESSKNDMNNDNSENLCSEQEIESRLSICKKCEYYKDNSCLLCGCQIVRESNYMNKLAHKNQKCPADKWGPIVDT